MKKFFYVLILTVFSVFYIKAQQSNLYRTVDSEVSFTSDAPLEVIRAASNQLSGVINVADKSFAFKIPMNSFEGFNSALQKTHFRENYMETDKYPDATFEGKIIEDIDFNTPGTYEVRGKGKFSVHGVEVVRIIKCKMIISPGTIKVSSEFSVFLEEHNIKIPSVVNQKIAEEIFVEMRATLKPK